MSGLFIVIEGGDGAGTTTQSLLLAGWLRMVHGLPTTKTCEPTDGRVGRLIRSILASEPGSPDKRCLPWLFPADRADHLYSTIEPALARGEIVVSDRYYHSSLAYQSMSEPMGMIWDFNKYFRIPDLTIFIDVPVPVVMKRIEARGTELEMFEKRATLMEVRVNYLEAIDLLGKEGHSIFIEDGDRPIEEVELAIREHVNWLVESEK